MPGIVPSAVDTRIIREKNVLTEFMTHWGKQGGCGLVNKYL